MAPGSIRSSLFNSITKSPLAALYPILIAAVAPWPGPLMIFKKG